MKLRYKAMTLILFLLLVFVSNFISYAVTEKYIELEYFADETGALLFEDIIKMDVDHMFDSSDDIPRTSDKSAVWLRFSVTSENNDLYGEVNAAHIDEVEFYKPVNENEYEVYKSGISRNNNTKEFNHANYVFSINGNNERAYYLKLKSYGNTSYDFKILTYKELLENTSDMNMFYFMIYGIIVGLTVYILFMWIGIRKLEYLYLFLFLMSSLIYSMTAQGYAYEIFNLEANMSKILMWSSVCASYIFSVLYTLSFFKYKVNRRVTFFLYGLMSLTILMTLSIVTEISNIGLNLWIINPLLYPLIIISIALVNLIRGYKPARFFMFAWFWIVLATILIAVGINIDLGFATSTIYPISTALNAIFLGFATADKYKTLTDEKRRLEAEKNELLNVVITDSLTELYNKSFMLSYLEQSVEREEPNNIDLSIVVLDIDDFKNINDEYGHIQGDKVLKDISKTILEIIGNDNFGCRFGGDEFVIILPDTKSEYAINIAELIRDKVVKLNTLNSKEKQSSVTVSLGVTQALIGDSVETLLERADGAMYKAKQLGKNRVLEL